MASEITHRQPIEIRIANVDLTAKLDALGAAVAAVRVAHRDEMSSRSWAALQRAQDAIAEAIIARNEGWLIRG